MEVIAPWFCFAPAHQSPPLAMVGYNKNIFCFIKNIFLHKGGGHCTTVVVLLVTARSAAPPPRLANCFLVLNYHCCCIFSDLQAQSWLVLAWNTAFLWIDMCFIQVFSSDSAYFEETPTSCHIDAVNTCVHVVVTCYEWMLCLWNCVYAPPAPCTTQVKLQLDEVYCNVNSSIDCRLVRVWTL